MIYKNQKEDSIDFILELIIDSIPTVKYCPLSSRSYFLYVREYRDSIGMDREGQYKQRIV
jgi:hypothetical protein